MNRPWQPHSWQQLPNAQHFDYPDQSLLDQTLATLQHSQPLVSPLEIQQLQVFLAEAGAGQRFILQAGDCAESFHDTNVTVIQQRIALLNQLATVLFHHIRLPILLLGRMAGQFAKPRSVALETRDEITLPSYRGDLINAMEFSETARTPDPRRLMQGYAFAAHYLDQLQHMAKSGITLAPQTIVMPGGGLRHGHTPISLNPQAWRLLRPSDRLLDQQIEKMIQTLPALWASLTPQHGPGFPLYTSHEAFHLSYETALTRQVNNQWFNLSTHLPWIGMRTAGIKEAHLEYIRGIVNPIGLKIGPHMTPAELQEIVRLLNPGNLPGRLCLIHRLGLQTIKQQLPALLKAVQDTGISVTWLNDPMHGNTHTTSSGAKYRLVSEMAAEIHLAFTIHQQHSSHLAGIHLEVSEQPIQECFDDTEQMAPAEASIAHGNGRIDPRLNFDQALRLLLNLQLRQ